MFLRFGLSQNECDACQVVWKSTTTVGCGYASCGASFIIPGGVFVVCRYSPAGNYLGEFAQNVFPPISNPSTMPSCNTAAAAPAPTPAPAPGAASAPSPAPAPALASGPASAGGPAPATASTACGSAAPDPWGDTLTKHNTYRAIDQVGPLAWDASGLSASASAWAAKCVFQHDPSNGANNIGENIYGSSAFAITSAGLSNAVDAWYGEVSSYNFSKPGFSSSTGHFTQVGRLGAVVMQLGCTKTRGLTPAFCTGQGCVRACV